MVTGPEEFPGKLLKQLATNQFNSNAFLIQGTITHTTGGKKTLLHDCFRRETNVQLQTCTSYFKRTPLSAWVVANLSLNQSKKPGTYTIDAELTGKLKTWAAHYHQLKFPSIATLMWKALY